MIKATEIKLGKDRNEKSADRRRGMKLVLPTSRTRPAFNIGISSNVFSGGNGTSPESPRKPATKSRDFRRKNNVETAVSTSTEYFAVGAAVGLIAAGFLGYMIGRKKR